jgi:hypothetical protein
MFHRWAALLLVLALCAMTPKNAAGQTQVQPRGQSAKGRLGPNYPNPFNPETNFPFTVGDYPICSEGSRLYTVSLQIHNMLMVPVATAKLKGSGTTSITAVPSGLQGAFLRNLKLACGQYEGHWSGFLDGSGKEAASGTYIARLIVDGKLAAVLRIFNSK